jgi:hypothetical protein
MRKQLSKDIIIERIRPIVISQNISIVQRFYLCLLVLFSLDTQRHYLVHKNAVAAIDIINVKRSTSGSGGGNLFGIRCIVRVKTVDKKKMFEGFSMKHALQY